MTDEKMPSAEDMNKARFMHLVAMFAGSAMQQMGRSPDPATGQVQQHMEAAQQSIDMIDMLALKTQGNLDKDEEHALSETLSMLRLTYVQSLKEGPAAAPPAPEEAAPAPQAPAEAQQSEQTATEPVTPPPATPGDEDKKEPRFRKSYG